MKNSIFMKKPKDNSLNKLSGLPNADEFYSDTQELLKHNPDKEFFLVRWDIENFKIFRDLFGLEVSDNLVYKLAQNLKFIIAGMGSYGQLGDDQFVMCFSSSVFKIEALIKIITEGLKKYTYNFSVVPNFGIYKIIDKSIPVCMMETKASIALQSAKNTIQKYSYYDESSRDILLKQNEISQDLEKAFLNKEFVVYYQPQYNHSTGELIGAEALVRWIHPGKGLIPPGDFVPILETSRYITELDIFVWEEVCKKLKSWADRKIMPVPISVNISRMDIHNIDLCQVITKLVEKYSIPTKLLNLEITESAYVNDSSIIIEIVKNLQQKGFCIEMDDFGSGYSSLNSLKDIPVNLLKLDMKFLSKGANSERGGNILNSIVRMAKWLSLPVLAEGVETIEQADYLKSIGCNLVQGYFYSKPIPSDVFDELISRSPVDPRISSKKILTSLNTNEFWDPDSQTSLLFNNLTGAACVFEVFEDTIELLRLNDSLLEIVGKTKIEVNRKARSIDKIIYPDDIDNVKKSLEEAIKSAEIIECEFRLFRSYMPNSYIWLNIKYRMIAKSAKRFVFYASISNITESKNQKLAIEYQRDNFYNLLQNAPIGIMLYKYTNKWETTFFNKTAMTIAKMENEEDFRNHFLDSNNYLNREYLIDKMILCYESNRKVNFTTQVKCLDGSIVSIDGIFQIVRGINNEKLIQSAFRDISVKEDENNDSIDEYDSLLYLFFDSIVEINLEKNTIIFLYTKNESTIKHINVPMNAELMIPKIINSSIYEDDRAGIDIFLKEHENKSSYDFRIISENRKKWVNAKIIEIKKTKFLVYFSEVKNRKRY